MKKIISLTLILGFLSFLPCLCAAPKKAGTVKGTKKTAQKSGSKAKKTQFVDLEALEVQGLIDRPQTLYILKKSETTFKDNIDEYDYMKAIIDPTYKEPF